MKSTVIYDSSIIDSEPNHSPAVAVVALLKHNCTLIKCPEKSGDGAASERLFSTAGIAVTKQKACLKPDVVGTIMLLYGSWRLVEEYWATRDEEEGNGLVVIDNS